MCSMSQLGVLEPRSLWYVAKICGYQTDQTIASYWRDSVPNAKRKAYFRVLITLIFKTSLFTLALKQRLSASWK